MKMFIVVVMVSLFASPLFCFSQETKAINGDLENIAGDCAECAAYFNLVYFALKDKEPEGAAKYGKLMDFATKLSLLASSKSRDPEMAAKVTLARIEMYKKQMRLEANNDNANISILINKYHFKCSEIMKNPEEYIKRLKNEK